MKPCFFSSEGKSNIFSNINVLSYFLAISSWCVVRGRDVFLCPVGIFARNETTVSQADASTRCSPFQSATTGTSRNFSDYEDQLLHEISVSCKRKHCYARGHLSMRVEIHYFWAPYFFFYSFNENLMQVKVNNLDLKLGLRFMFLLSCSLLTSMIILYERWSFIQDYHKGKQTTRGSWSVSRAWVLGS